MSKGSYSGGGTVIGPRDKGWYGTSAVKAGRREDAAEIERRKNANLTAQSEKRIADLRVDVAGLRRELAVQLNVLTTLRKKIAGSEGALAELLHQHGLPLDPGLERPAQNHGPNMAKRARTAKRGKIEPKATK